MNVHANKLISEFMGLKPNPHNQDPLHPTDFAEDEDKCIKYVDMKYHIKWDDWLMPVVEKIEEIALEEVKGVYKRHRFCVNFNFTQAEITDMSTGMIVGYGDVGRKLDSTYIAVLEFIMWYNKNKKE